MARKIKGLDGLGSEVFDNPDGQEEMPADDSQMPIEEDTQGMEDPTGDTSGELVDPSSVMDPSMLAQEDPSMMGGGMPEGDLSQLSDNDLMALLSDDGIGGGMNQVGPQVDMLEGALNGEGTSPDDLAMIQNDLALAARRRMAGL